MDTSFSYCEPGRGFFSSDEQKWIRKIRKLQKEYPDKIRMIAEPETNDGCIYCELPAEWMKLVPKRKSNMTEEERAAVGERLRAAQRKN